MNRRRFVKTGLLFVPALVLPHDLVRASGFLPIPTLNDETYRWAYGRIPTAGGTISAASIMRNDALITGMKQMGLRTKVKRLNTYSGDFAALKAPIINDWGTTQETFAGFVSGDFVETGVGGGLTGGAGRYIDTGVDPNALASTVLNDWHIGLYVITGSDAATDTSGAQRSGFWHTNVYVSLAGTTYWDCWIFTDGRASFADSAGKGFYVGTRTSAASSIIYKNAVNKASVGVTTASPANGGSATLAIFALHDSGSGYITNSARTQALHSEGLGLSATDVTNYYNLVQTFQTGMGRQV